MVEIRYVGHPDQQFLPDPEDKLSALLVARNIEMVLPDPSPKIVEFIYQCAKKLFAIALRCGITGYNLLRTMEPFQRHKFHDNSLPTFRSQECGTRLLKKCQRRRLKPKRVKDLATVQIPFVTILGGPIQYANFAGYSGNFLPQYWARINTISLAATVYC